MKNKVLVTHGTRPFAQRVAKFLPDKYTPLFASADEMPSVLISGGSFVQIPPAQAPSFLHQVLKTCLDHGVSDVIPLGAGELYPMAQALPLFLEYGIDVWVPHTEVLTALPLIENPPRQLPLQLLHKGKKLNGEPTVDAGEDLSGVFILSDDGEGWALCCVAD